MLGKGGEERRGGRREPGVVTYRKRSRGDYVTQVLAVGSVAGVGAALVQGCEARFRQLSPGTCEAEQLIPVPQVNAYLRSCSF